MDIKKKSLKLNVLLNLIKAFTSILFPMITFKYASTVLSADNLGTVNFCSSIIGYFSLFAALGVSSYAAREGPRFRGDKKKISLFSSQVFSINCLSCLLSFVCLLIAINTIDSLKPYYQILLMQSLTMIFTTLGTEWINIIYEDFAFITIRTIIMQIISLILLFIFVKGSDDYLIYVAVTVFGQVGMYVLNIFHVKKTVNIHFTYHIEWHKHIKSIITIFASSIAVSIYATIDTTMIGIFCDKSDVAYYAAASKIYVALKSIFATVLVVMVPRLSYLISQSKENYYDLLDRITRGIFILLIPCTILSNILCKDLILLISGESYLSASSSLHILSFAVVFSAFSTCIVNNVFLIKKYEKITLIATTVGAIVDFVMNFVLIKKIGYFGASITTLISEICVFVICCISMRAHRMNIIYTKKIFSCLVKDFIAGGIMILVCIFLNQISVYYVIRIIVVGLVGGSTFVVTLLLMKHDLLCSEFETIRNKLLNSYGGNRK